MRDFNAQEGDPRSKEYLVSKVFWYVEVYKFIYNLNRSLI